jgi:uncharacterized membrane protein YfhO
MESYKNIQEAQSRIVDRDFKAAESVLISADELQNISLNGVGSGSARVKSYKPNKIELEVSTDKNAVLVSSEVHYPGWRATIGGQHSKTLLVNTAFRGLYVPAGNHRVTFTYESASFRTGAAISVIAFSIVLILIVFRSR